jgi:hypothetical protein
MATPAQMRDRYQRIAFRYRNVPGRFGLRPYSVSMVTRAYDGGELGQGTMTETITPITERDGLPPKCRNMTSEELAVAGYDKQTWEIGPVTPTFSGGGTLIATLTNDDLSADTEPHFILTGPEFPDGARFRRVRFQSDKALHYTLQVQKVAEVGAAP